MMFQKQLNIRSQNHLCKILTQLIFITANLYAISRNTLEASAKYIFLFTLQRQPSRTIARNKRGT